MDNQKKRKFCPSLRGVEDIKSVADEGKGLRSQSPFCGIHEIRQKSGEDFSPTHIWDSKKFTLQDEAVVSLGRGMAGVKEYSFLKMILLPAVL